MSPNVNNQTFFFGGLVVNPIGFWTLWIIFSSLLGVGLAFTFGIAPNWYSSLIDLNLPEHRGTMVAMGSFIDTFGRALGSIIGGFMISITDNFSLTIFWSTLIFGIISTFFWIPLFFTGKKDFAEIDDILKNRAKNLVQET
jgi:MFS family permease